MKIKIVKITILVLWMIVIFLLSNQNGSESQSLSDSILCSIINNCDSDLYSFIIRKLAHFTLYFILGIFALINFKITKDNIINAFLICIIFAFTDEMHQMYVDNRSGELRDILIDSLGSLSSILFIYKLKKRD